MYKVIIKKSRREVSPVEQYTIDRGYLAYFEPKKITKNKIIIRYILCNFSVWTLQCLKKKLTFFCPRKHEKKPSKVPQNRPNFFFQYCQPAQNQPRSQFLFHKNVSLRYFYKKTLGMYSYLGIQLTSGLKIGLTVVCILVRMKSFPRF